MFLFAETDLGKSAINVMEDTTLNMPVMLDSLQDNYLYLCSGNHQMNRHFSSVSLDMLIANDDNEVIFIDVKGLGSEYAVDMFSTAMICISSCISPNTSLKCLSEISSNVEEARC